MHSFRYSLFRTEKDGNKVLLRGPFEFRSNIHKFEGVLKGPSASRLETSSEVKVVSFGNHDTNGTATFDALAKEKADLYILVGNYAFDVNDDSGLRGDQYFSWMEAVFARTPVLLTAGSRENFQNTEFFNSRFMMPGTRKPTDNNLFAVNSQYFQLLALNFDFLILNPSLVDFFEMSFVDVIKKFKLRKDSHFTWFVSSKPLHCKQNYTECEKLASNFNSFEKQLKSIKVHLNLWGSVNHYERLKAIFDHQVLKPTNRFSLVLGTGGNKEDSKRESQKAFDFLETEAVATNGDPSDDAITSEHRGFARVTVKSKQVTSEFFSVDNSSVIDKHFIFSDSEIDHFPTFMWLFFGILIFFCICILVCFVKYLGKKNKENSKKDESLIEDDSLMINS